jgi:hypothetical protein
MSGRGGKLAVTLPEYGTVEAAVWLVLAGLVVARASVALVETVRVVAPTVPGLPVRAVPWLLLAVIAVVVAGRELRRQRGSNPHEFLAREVRAAFLDQHRLGVRGALLALLAVGGGAVVVSRARGSFLTALDGFLFLAKRYLESGTLVAFAPRNVALGVGFLLGVGLLARGLDRLLVGGGRELVRWRYRG